MGNLTLTGIGRCFASFFIVWVLHLAAFGQNISGDISSLSDAEIQSYWSDAQSKGVVITQLKAHAIANGLDPNQADLLVTRVNAIQASNASSAASTAGTSVASLSAANELKRFQDQAGINNLKDRLFGLNYFDNSSFDFSPSINMPTPENYVLGPGDNISIQVYGTSQQGYKLTITPEGNITIPFIGPLSLSGLTVEAAKSKLIKDLSSIYAGLSQKPQSVFLELTVSDIRSIRVNVIGEVQNPGSYTLSSFATPIAAIYASGGPTISGTFREIKVYRGGNLAGTVDLYEFFNNGKLPSFGTVQDEDIIVIGPYTKHVQVVGRVKRPAVYEIKDSESVQDALRLGGGFAAGSFKQSISVSRLVGSDQSYQDIAEGDDSFRLEDGDRILIRDVADPFVEKVQVSGAVLRGGSYGWSEGMSVKNLLDKAGGLLPEAYKSHVTIFRKDEDLSTNAITIDLSDGSIDLERSLEIGDLLLVSSQYALTETPFVKVDGEVLKPGVLPFYDGMTISDAILLSSGLTNASFSGLIELVRRPHNSSRNIEFKTYNLRGGIESLEDKGIGDIELTSYDYLFVRQSENYLPSELITIEGEVKLPGKYVLQDRNTRISDVLERSGGITEFAFPPGSYILRNNRGNSKIGEARKYLQNLERLNFVLDDKLAGGTLSVAERIALDKKLTDLREKYRLTLLNNGIATGDSLSFWTVDSVYLDPISEYSKVSFSLQDILDGKKDPANDLILRNGDKLVIPTEPQTVEIIGQALNGNTVTRYVEKARFEDYVGAAGGYTSSARRRKAYIIYPNGLAQRSRSFLFFSSRPKVLPGSQIVIPGGKVRGTVDVERIFGLISTAATTYLLFLTIQDRQSN